MGPKEVYTEPSTGLSLAAGDFTPVSTPPCLQLPAWPGFMERDATPPGPPPHSAHTLAHCLGSWGWRLHHSILVPPTLSPTSEVLGQFFPSRHPWPEGVQPLPSSASGKEFEALGTQRPAICAYGYGVKSTVLSRGWAKTLNGLQGLSHSGQPCRLPFSYGSHWSENNQKNHCDDHPCPPGLVIPLRARYTFWAVRRNFWVTRTQLIPPRG